MSDTFFVQVHDAGKEILHEDPANIEGIATGDDLDTRPPRRRPSSSVYSSESTFSSGVASPESSEDDSSSDSPDSSGDSDSHESSECFDQSNENSHEPNESHNESIMDLDTMPHTSHNECVLADTTSNGQALPDTLPTEPVLPDPSSLGRGSSPSTPIKFHEMSFPSDGGSDDDFDNDSDDDSDESSDTGSTKSPEEDSTPDPLSSSSRELSETVRESSENGREQIEKYYESGERSPKSSENLHEPSKNSEESNKNFHEPSEDVHQSSERSFSYDVEMPDNSKDVEQATNGYMHVILQKEDTGHGVETFMKEIALPLVSTWSEIASILRRFAPTLDQHGRATGHGLGKWMYVLVSSWTGFVIKGSTYILDSDKAYQKFVEKMKDTGIGCGIVVRHSTYHGYTKAKLDQLVREREVERSQQPQQGVEANARDNPIAGRPVTTKTSDFYDRPERFPMFFDDPNNLVPQKRPWLDG